MHENRRAERNDADAHALDEEIAFRQSPVFEEPAGPPMPLPANLIEFPRQLVAARKARPRYAEGPLREEDGAECDGQLRIFEVDPAQISTAPDSAETPEPQWTSIWLGEGTQNAPGTDNLAETQSLEAALPGSATILRRVVATTVNGCVITAGLVAFAAAFTVTSGQRVDWRSAAGLKAAALEIAGRVPGQPGFQPGAGLAGVAVAAAFLYLAYQGLFFTLSHATPGMRCARIALCTFDDDNPTRRAMRRRIVAVLLSACPFGLGFLWAALDEDRLTWHDRVSKMYQRSY
jgi:uncharacterized RDD family membrane protein YckC